MNLNILNRTQQNPLEVLEEEKSGQVAARIMVVKRKKEKEKVERKNKDGIMAKKKKGKGCK